MSFRPRKIVLLFCVILAIVTFIVEATGTVRTIVADHPMNYLPSLLFTVSMFRSICLCIHLSSEDRSLQ